MAAGGEMKAGTAATRRGMIAGALVALVVAAGIAVARQRATPDLVVQSDEGWAGEVRVAVGGAVAAPGTYTLSGDARLADLIAAAGGYTEGANRDVLNPAARVSDGQSYTVPLQPTPAPRGATSSVRAAASARPGTPPAPTEAPVLAAVTAQPAPPAPPTPDAPRPTSGAASTAIPGPAATVAMTATPVPTANGAATKVNLNTATRAELEALPLIGPALAERILQDRAANGPYRTIDDLARVRGISPRTVEQLRDRLTV